MAIIFFYLSSKNTRKCLSKTLCNIIYRTPDIPILILGNKSDISTYTCVRQNNRVLGKTFFEISCKTGLCIDEVRYNILRNMRLQ